MNHKLTHLLIRTAVLLTAAAAMCACNDDIFIEDTRIEETSATIEGDGGQHTFRIKTKGLLNISLAVYNGTGVIIYYDKNGDYISPDSPVSEISRIEYSEVACTFNIYFGKNSMTVASTENAIAKENTIIDILLQYKNSNENITINLTPGKPMELIGVDYNFNQVYIENNARIERFTTHYVNNGDKEMHIIVMPYAHAQSSIVLNPNQTWAYGMKAELPLPLYLDGKWTVTQPRLIQLGTSRYYSPDGIDTQLKVPLTIPPHQSIQATTTLSYMKAELPVTITTRAPVSGCETMSLGKCTITAPTNYEISTKAD